jgi:hypothetical protein
MIQLIICCILLYFFRNSFNGLTTNDVDEYIAYDYISDGELDGDMFTD